MTDVDRPSVINELRRLIEEHYVFPDMAEAISRRLADGVAAGRYAADPAEAGPPSAATRAAATNPAGLTIPPGNPAAPAGPTTPAGTPNPAAATDPAGPTTPAGNPAAATEPAGPTTPAGTPNPAAATEPAGPTAPPGTPNPADPSDLAGFAAAVTADLQDVSRDKHLRLIHHAEPLPEAPPGDDAEQWAAMRHWAAATCGGVAEVARRDGNVGYLRLDPVLFPTPIAAEPVGAAFTILADCDALILDLRGCLGGEPTMVAFIASYLWDHEPVQLTALRHRTGEVTQSWTLPVVPGRRFGRDRPLYVLTSATTFSGGEQLAYDLQQLGRATLVGERTRGGANAREAFWLTPHLEATIPVAASVNPRSGTNWDGVGVTPDVAVPAAEAEAAAYKLIAGSAGKLSRSTDD